MWKTVAWHYENNGIFTVKSAYKLALNIKHLNHGNEGSSNQTTGGRSIWNCIWKANVPPKVRIFGWRVATDALPTKKNKWRRTLEANDRCYVCGSCTEDAHHAVIACTKARALRQAMREIWELPSEEDFRYTGKGLASALALSSK